MPRSFLITHRRYKLEEELQLKGIFTVVVSILIRLRASPY